MNKQEKLAEWKRRFEEAKRNREISDADMDEREDIYNGRKKVDAVVRGDREMAETEGALRTAHVQNVAFELVEAQVSTVIPQPKVTARNKEDEGLAQKIEYFLRGEIDRMPFEAMNDLAERCAIIQGAVGYLVEWDGEKSTHDTVGELSVSVIHPKQFFPQPGVFGSVEDMDWFVILFPSTRDAVERRYGVSVECERESEPDVRTNQEERKVYEDAVTVCVGYQKTDEGIDKFTWCNDVILEDLENYQAKRKKVCASCGRAKPHKGQILEAKKSDGFRKEAELMESANDGALRDSVLSAAANSQIAASVMETEDVIGVPGSAIAAIEFARAPERVKRDACPFCGGEEWSEEPEDGEEIFVPFVTSGGVAVDGEKIQAIEGKLCRVPNLLPAYRPGMYPLVLQKSVSVYGRLFGSSDIDIIRDQQNTLNRINQQILDRMMEAGTVVTLPMGLKIEMTPENHKAIYVRNASDLASIGVYDFKGDLSYEMQEKNIVYEEARRTLGITNAFQGREDTTAKSGVAKQFQAAQSAGRLESKRVMKEAAYADLYRSMFEFFLAYSNEPRTISHQTYTGGIAYDVISKYDFLKQDESGYYWENRFLFSVDASSGLATNRQAMWQETRNNFQSGAYGNPSDPMTLLIFWEIMEGQHYPEAWRAKQAIKAQIQAQQDAMQRQAEASAMMRGLASNRVGGSAEDSSENIQKAEEGIPALGTGSGV